MRNIRPAFRWGLWAACFTAHSILTFSVVVRRGPCVITMTTRNWRARTLSENRLSETGRQAHFDRLSSVFLSNTNHEENQPSHLRLKDEKRAGVAQSGSATARRKRVTARPVSMRSSVRRRCAAPANQCAELPALQNL